MTKKLLFNAARILVSLGLIAFLLWMMRGNIGQVATAIKQANRLILAAAFLLFLTGVILSGFRLRSVIKAQHLKLRSKDVIYLTFIGQFFSNFLPTSTGGDIVKAYYVSKRTGKKLHSVACVLMDRMLGTVTLFLMVLVATFFVKGVYISRTIKIFLLATLAASILIGVILFSRRIARRIPFVKILSNMVSPEGKMKGLYDILYNYKKHPKLLLNAIALSFLLQFVIYSSVYLIIRSLNFNISPKLVFLWMPIISTMSMAPSINGLGVRESSFVFFFGPLMGKHGAFALSILWLGINFGVSLIGGVLYLFNKQYKIKKEALTLNGRQKFT